MSFRRTALVAIVAVASLASATPSKAVTLTLNFSGGSLADPIVDALSASLGAGDLIFLYSSPTSLNSGDLFSSIFQTLPGGGLSFHTPSSVLSSTSVGSGISPPISLDGRVRGQLDLGNIQAPTAAPGTLLYLLAINASDLLLATEAGISSESFTVPTLPDMNDAPPLPVDFVATGFATVSAPAVPEASAVVMLLSGLAAFGARMGRASR